MAALRLTTSTASLAQKATRIAPLLALTCLACYPVLASGLPATGDGLNHYYRLAQLEWHVWQGDVYPRWFTNLGYGFGLPVLNFYSPLSYYIPLLFRAVGFSLATALQLSYALALATAALGAYVWAQTLCGETEREHAPLQPPAPWLAPPLLTAAAYGLAPYFYFNIFHRGAYPETWALAVAPWLLWAVHRLARVGKARVAVLCALLLAAIILTHSLSALIMAPLAFIYGLGLALLAAGRREAGAFVRNFLFAVGVCLALTAFFTLPILFESQYIQLHRTYNTGDLDYRRNFLGLATLLAPPPNYDPLLVFNSIPPSLGWPQGLLALTTLGVGLLALRRRRLAYRAWLIPGWLAALILLLAALTLVITEPLWSLIPLARYIQFPWRLVGPASLLLAALAGLAPVPLRGRRLMVGARDFGSFDFWLAAAGLLACFAFSLPWSFHADFGRFAPGPGSAEPAAAIRYEIDSGQLGTSSTGEYLPRWVTALPEPETLLPRFAHTEVPVRLAPLPRQAAEHSIDASLYSQALSYASDSPFTATFYIFYFPGWTATLDGRPIELEPSLPHGLITVAAPAGRHVLRLERTLTPPQFIGSLVSLVTGVALAGFIIHAAQRAAPGNRNPLPLTYPARPLLGLAALVVCLLALRIAYFDRVETVFHYTRIDRIPNETSAVFEGQLELMGYEYALPAGFPEPLSVTLYWRALQPLTADYSVSVQLADRFGNRFGQSDNQHPNGVPTSRWRMDQYARDTHTLHALEGTPPGEYRLLVTVYGERPLSLLEDGAPAGVAYELGSTTVPPVSAYPEDALGLVEARLAASTAMVGDPLALTVVWSAGQQPLPRLAARLEIVNNSGQAVLVQDLPPAGPDYPTEQWLTGSRVRYPLSVTLPPELEGGAAEVRLSLVEEGGAVAAGPYAVGNIRVDVPERSFEIPPMQARVDHPFEDAIRLLGYDLRADSITLYWQAMKTVSTPLTVFVHTLDEAGTLVAGHDAAPARATTGWLPGEVIADAHPIVITGVFEVGLYDPITGARFGETFVTGH